MRIPALRAKMGIWIYYVSTLSFRDICKYVRPINDELHKSKLLSDMIQRSITDNYKSIAHYLETQEERFFNALILAVYDGNPVWNEIRLEGENGEDIYDLGLLSLSGEEKIFPVDGQHRVEGIKQALTDKPELENEKVPVIFVGHSKDSDGMQRTRRMFSTLNRYAKPVSMRDIIALDEDDIVAIVSRELIDSENFFIEGKIFDAKTKALPENNTKAFTSIITYYNCNRELLWLLIKDIEVKGLDDKVIKGKSVKINEYIRHRPADSMLFKFLKLCKHYWLSVFSLCDDYIKVENADVGIYRNKDGGHVFFRPVSLLPFTKAVVRIREKRQESFEVIIRKFPERVMWIQERIWRKIIWDNEQKKMITTNQKLIELLLLYAYDKTFLTNLEIKKIEADIASLWDVNRDDALELVDEIVVGEEYIGK